MVEEAGQVLEAHILTSLVPSSMPTVFFVFLALTSCILAYARAIVHHLICIGDPQQLRPNLATYGMC